MNNLTVAFKLLWYSIRPWKWDNRLHSIFGGAYIIIRANCAITDKVASRCSEHIEGIKSILLEVKQ